MNYTTLLTESRNRILYITINRESKLNALNKETLAEINHVLTKALAEDEIAGMIITGAGPKAFVAGADIAEFSLFGVDEGTELARQGQDSVFNLLYNSGKPVIACINGFALGGGLELAMACHIRIASHDAKMGLPEVSLGLIPGYGGTQRLTQLVGRGRALEMILTGDMITAEEAWRIGLVNHVVEKDGILAKAEEILYKIMDRSPTAVSRAITSVNAGLESGVNGYDVEISEFGACFGSSEFNEGVSAFLEKRKPDFRNNTGKV